MTTNIARGYQMDSECFNHYLSSIRMSRLEAVMLCYSRVIYTEWTDVFEWVAHTLTDHGELFGVTVGAATFDEVCKAFDELLKRKLITRVTENIALEIIAEQVASTGKSEFRLDQLVGAYMYTEEGLKIYLDLFENGVSSWMEEDELRWFTRGAGYFSLYDNCTAMRDAPQSYRCCILGCRLENIGPWAIYGNAVMPKGWRLICNRRADGN